MMSKGSDNGSRGRADGQEERRWWGEERSVARTRRQRDSERTWKSAASPDRVGFVRRTYLGRMGLG